MHSNTRFRSAALLCFLAISLSLSSFFAQAGKLETQRLLYDQAMGAIEKGDMARYRQLEAGLRDYPLYGYLVLADLNRNFDSASDEQLRVFLRTYGDLPFANRLKARWLSRLARQGKWNEFTQNYAAADKSAAFDCQLAMHQWNSGDRAHGMQQAQALWTVGRSQPNACDPLFERWQQAGGLTEDIVWQRLRLALLYRQDGLARYLTKQMPSQQALAERFVDTATKPTLLRQTANYRVSASQPANKVTDIATVALRRLGRDDSQAALEIWPLYKDLPYTEEDRLAITRDIGVRRARKIDPAALTFMATNDPLMKDDEISEWRIRLALRTRNWEIARSLTQQMPASMASQSRWRYWKLRSAQLASSESGELINEYKALAQERDFYGFLAAERSGQPYALNHVSAPVSDQQLAELKALPSTQRAYEFLARDEVVNARREWYHAGDNFSREQLMAQAKLAREMAWYFPAIRGISIAEYWDDLDIRFPMAYQEPIMQQARARQINSTWVYAITRQESAFMADARSHAGAMGLMQLMPATARETARQYDIPYGSANDALIPERNIAIGTAYLSRLNGQFKGNRVLASAAYNAGPGRVRQWTNGMGSLPADVWVEAIPFDETRKYVQSVLSYAVIYGEKLGIKQSVMEQHERYLEF
ncbi:MAG: transglycosylase SLT domain-containing protein [Halopseudomonas sp.]|uniref:transglycosylase SLT domain-containing protein n=1 Tax=Halopseudomonas sp. TaxID=2901191 RepID=UPI0030027548